MGAVPRQTISATNCLNGIRLSISKSSLGLNTVMDKNTYAAIRAKAHERINARKGQLTESQADNELISFDSVESLMEALLEELPERTNAVL